MPNPSSKNKIEKNAKTLTGSEIFLECLQQEGVEVIFGYPGGVVLPIYDKLLDYKIKHYLVRHEQNAAFAAQGYARATGKPGICMATSGPGATNLVTGLTDAYCDSIPVVAFTGQVSTSMIGSDAFQEADTIGITRSCTKHNYFVRDLAELPAIVKAAFHVATTGRPGPVLVDIPKDVLIKQGPFIPAKEAKIFGRKKEQTWKPGEISKAVSMIWNAERPVIYAGGGIIHANAAAKLKTLAELTGIPVTTTVMGLGGFPSDHPLSLGMLGMHGRYATNSAVTQTDLLIGLGVRFDDRVTGKLERFAQNAKIIHVDIDPAEINKIVEVDLPIVGDLSQILDAMIEEIKKTKEAAVKSKKEAREKWMKRIKEWQKAHPLTYDKSDTEIKPQFLLEELDKLIYGKSVVSVDVGQHQMWAAQYLRFNEPRRWANSGGLGSMGFGLPASIGAAVGKPDKIAIALIGDGGFQMSLPELGTLATYKLPVKVIIMNNRYLGMVRQWQELFYNRRYSEVEFEVFPDCVKLGEAFGIPGKVVSKPQELVPALQKALDTPGPYILDVRVSREENVYPIVPAGGALDEMILYPETAKR